MNEDTGPRLVTFEPTPAGDVLDKLNREIERIERAAEMEDAADHITNAVWTAWLMHQWVWAAIKDHEQLRTAVLKFRGLDEANISDHASFGAALAGRFVPLKICRIVATTPRYARVLLSEDPSSATSQDDENLSKEMRNVTTLNVTPVRLMPAIVVMGRAVAAARLLREVEEYWATLIRECGLDQIR